MAPPILVTGAAGFAGSHLLDLLQADDVPVVAWRRPGERLPAPPTGTQCQWMEVELLDAGAVRAAVRAIGPSVVYHLAGLAHVGGSWSRTHQTLRVNVLGTHHLLTAVAALAARPRVLITGSAHVYREQDRAVTELDPIGPASPYALSKLAQELAGAHAAADLGLAVLLTRPFNHIGPRQDGSFFASGVARHIVRVERGLAAPILDVGNLEARRDLMDVRDTVRAYRAIAEHGRPGAVYNVCGGRAYRIGDLLDALLARGRVAIEVRRDPARLRPHDAPLVLGDHGRLTRELGWEPHIPIEQTVADLLEYWRGVADEPSRAPAEVADARPGPTRRP
jgi:GDP-4-dehydro-6-deoxy-D-mannose reductase